MEFDYLRLREDLMDYYGSAMANVSPLAVMDLTTVETMNDAELVNLAKKLGFNVERYIKRKQY